LTDGEKTLNEHFLLCSRTCFCVRRNDFGCCIHDDELTTVPYTGLNKGAGFKFSWYNVQQEGDAMKKLDWIFGNPSLFSSLLRAHSKFLPRDYFDNSV